jgi:hypothetical protein
MDKLIDYLTVAYFAHTHFISRREMIEELRLPVVLAETLHIDQLIWELYEDYAQEFQSREPYDAQFALNSAGTANPVVVSIKGKYIESSARTDTYVQTITLQGTGTPNFNFTVPQNIQVDPAILQQLWNHFSQELNNQLKPLQVAKKISSFGEWRSE